MRKLFLSLLCVPVFAFANTSVELDHAPINSRDKISLQRGARNFVNYCLTCHSANYMRYSRLQDLGLNEDQIRNNLIQTGVKVGETMSIALKAQDAKAWFGAAPPDLTVIARSRGPDWLYSYLRGFYRDSSRQSGWNNTVFPQVGMPHVLYELQGQQIMVSEKTEHGEHHKLHLEKPGKLTPAEYDQFVADLVNYLDYMGEPHKAKRIQTGIIVMFFLALLFPLAVLVKKEYWKDVK
jgi:ubiquinol-cytochrome c reductase cytochrome c1 subunit